MHHTDLTHTHLDSINDEEDVPHALSGAVGGEPRVGKDGSEPVHRLQTLRALNGSGEGDLELGSNLHLARHLQTQTSHSWGGINTVSMSVLFGLLH